MRLHHLWQARVPPRTFDLLTRWARVVFVVAPAKVRGTARHAATIWLENHGRLDPAVWLAKPTEIIAVTVVAAKNVSVARVYNDAACAGVEEVRHLGVNQGSRDAIASSSAKLVVPARLPGLRVPTRHAFEAARQDASNRYIA